MVTVGATDDQTTLSLSDDTPAWFSSWSQAGTSPAKPDLVAPGVGAESLSAPDSTLYATRSAYLLNGTVATSFMPYLVLSGTSQAAPVVAKPFALPCKHRPRLDKRQGLLPARP